MTQHAYDVGTADFERKVLAASRRVPVVVDFWAPWCQPCRILKPILEKLASEYGGRFLLARVNSDENQELAMRHGVRGIPAVKAFVDGVLADEFTGALPEAEVREFLDRLIPSPAEPLRREAMALAASGDVAGARRKLAGALALDPRNEGARVDLAECCLAAGDAQALAQARELLAELADRSRDPDRVASLRARLRLAERAGGGDVASLRARLAADPGDLGARLELAHALALAREYRGAFENLLEIVRRDRKWNDEAGRKGMIDLFTLLAGDARYEDLVREFRVALAHTLN